MQKETMLTDNSPKFRDEHNSSVGSIETSSPNTKGRNPDIAKFRINLG